MIETQAQQFADTYFDGLAVDQLRISGKLRPKMLLVAPQRRLSWQYHHRRAEIWQHTDTANPSDEDGIMRVQDDFGR